MMKKKTMKVVMVMVMVMVVVVKVIVAELGEERNLGFLGGYAAQCVTLACCAEKRMRRPIFPPLRESS
jgi:hypothetical protein